MLLVGLVVGAGAAWYTGRRELGAVVTGHRSLVEALNETVATLRKDLHIAEDRLYHAWHEKAIIPPRPVDQKPLPPLPIECAEEVAQWESAEVRANVQHRLQELVASGMNGRDAVSAYRRESTERLLD